MADEKKINHEFQWNSDPSFFTRQPTEDQQITLGPDLSWPLMTTPEPESVLNRQREKVRKISVSHEKAA
jgi:hypothetical protein